MPHSQRLIAAGRPLLHSLLVVVGGYFLSAALVALGAVGLSSLGMARSEAVVSFAMLGFVIYLMLLIWGFALRRWTPLLVVYGASPLLYYLWQHAVAGAAS